MAHSTTQTSNPDVTKVLATWLNKKFISDLVFRLQMQKFTAEAEIPEGFGAKIGRFIDFAPPTRTGYAAGATAITEGSTTANEITGITTGGTDVTVAEYGEFMKVTDLYGLASLRGTRERLSKRLRDAGAVSIDSVVRNAAVTSTNVWVALSTQAGGAASGTATAMGAATLISGRKVLFDALCTGFEGVEGHMDGNFAAVLSPKQEQDIITEVTTGRIYWSNCVVNVPGRGGQEKFLRGYIGDVYNVSTYVTQNYTTTTIGSAIDIGFILASDGIAACGFKNMQPEIIINDVNSPFKNLNSIAWHSYFGAALVSSTRVLKLYSLS